MLDPTGRRVRRPRGVVVDLSSMQHGRGADEVSSYLRSLGVSRFLVDVGSEIRASGDSSEGTPWQVAIERPPPETGDGSTDTAIRVIALRDAGIATSGNYRYFFDYDGRRYSHRIDPRTAEPITHPLASVTVIDPVCMHADALATALTILGPVEGFDFASKRDIAALFIVRSAKGLEERMTPKFAAYLN
jgi:thiamine biosynthesis lipoprotein